MARDHRYIYLCYGPSPQTARELRYSLETLLPEIGGDASRVSVFTDCPEDFRDLPVATVDFSADLAPPAGGKRYYHRVKPLALARALQLYGRACALIDADSFIREGFDARVGEALAAGAAMNEFVRADPYPDFGPFDTDLPHLGRYVYNRETSLMYNSGLIAARAEYAPLLEDAVVLIERLWAGGLKRHDIEQFAVSECFRLGGVPIREINREFEHYFSRWSKRYMRRQLRERAPGEEIKFSKTRVRLFKGMWNLRLGLRRLRR
jgi:hypothetical protein